MDTEEINNAGVTVHFLLIIPRNDLISAPGMLPIVGNGTRQLLSVSHAGIPVPVSSCEKNPSLRYNTHSPNEIALLPADNFTIFVARLRLIQ